jgi:hypothetical protein
MIANKRVKKKSHQEGKMKWYTTYKIDVNTDPKLLLLKFF